MMKPAKPTTPRRAKPDPTPPAPAKEDPERTAEEKALVIAWLGRYVADPAPRWKTGADGNAEQAGDDEYLFFAKLAEAVGVDNPNLAMKLVSQTADCIRKAGGALKSTLAVAGIQSIGPRDGVESMLAAQMVATHHAAMGFLRCAEDAQFVEHMSTSGAIAVKLLRTYAAQVEALSRHRGKGQQTVRVEHVHVHSGGQAIVGAVNPGGSGGGIDQNGRQPYEHAAITHDPGAPVPCPHPARDAVPVPGDAERAV